MLRTERTMMMGMFFVIPGMLCFIGVGAFLHIVVRVSAAQQEEDRKQVEAQIEQDERRAAELAAAIERLEQEIDAIRKRLAELQEAEVCQAELARLQELKERLEKERLALLRKLEALKAGSGSHGEEGESLRQQEAEARRKLEALKQEITRLNQKIAQMTPSAAPGGDPPEEGPSLDELRAAIARLNRELEALKNKKKQAETELANLGPKRDGPKITIGTIHGSFDWQPPSNPLYVECARRGAVLQPENIRLPVQPDQAAQDRFLRVARQRRYVLFLIRPDGFDAFRAYRPLVMQNKIDFGYEPIPQDAWVDY